MDEEREDPMPPFWLQTTPTHHRLRISRHRSSSPLSFFFSSGFLIVVLLATAFVFFFFFIPSFLSLTSQIFKPNVVKRSWDSLNLVLVLFAVLCGFLGRNNNNITKTEAVTESTTPIISPLPQDQLILKSDPLYPDLNLSQETESVAAVAADERWRYYSHADVFASRFSISDQSLNGYGGVGETNVEGECQHVFSNNVEEELNVDAPVDESEEQRLVDTEVPPQSPPPTADLSPSLPPSPSFIPPELVKRKKKRIYRDLAWKSTESIEEPDSDGAICDPLEAICDPLEESASPLPPLPPLSPPQEVVHEESVKREKRRGPTKDFLMSLKRKKKKQRQKSVENLEGIFEDPPSSSDCVSLQQPPSPPPQKTPPTPFFHYFFSKKGKTKKTPSPPPPPPPPPPPAVPLPRSSRTKSHKVHARPQTHSLPAEVTIYNNNVEESRSSTKVASMPPLPPPPPPPFKMHVRKYGVQGEYRRLVSNNNSLSGSLDLYGGDDLANKETGSSGCSSPDVDSEADNFIARFRAGLKLETMNSMKEKEGRGKSNLGPSSPQVQQGR